MLLITFVTVSASSALADTCTEWDAAFSTTRTAGRGSQGLTYTWSTAPSCDTFALDHYEVCWNDEVAGGHPSAPTSPDDAEHCSSVSPIGGANTMREVVYRSNHVFAASIFACADGDCLSWYGDGSVDESVINDVSAASTTKERWVLKDVTDRDDTDRVVADDAAEMPTALVYPRSTTAAGRLGVWYVTKVGGVDTIMQQMSTTAGWHGWNSYTSWTDPDPVVQAPVDAMGSFGAIGAPFVVPATDGEPYVRLFFRADDDGVKTTGDTWRLWSVDSADDLGKDFGLECVGPMCDVDGASCLEGGRCDFEDVSADGGAAMLEIDNTGGEDSEWITAAGHGRVLFPFVSDADKLIDFETESPRLVFTGSSACDGGADDLFTSEWNGDSWDVPVVDECPVATLEESADPAVLPLPNNMSKVYIRKGATFEVCLFDGPAVLDCQPIELSFDDGTLIGSADPTLPACLDQLETVSTRVGSTQVEGGFVRAITQPGCFEVGNGGIVYLEHRN